MTRFTRGTLPFTPMGANLLTIVSGTVVTYNIGTYSPSAFDARLAGVRTTLVVLVGDYRRRR